MGDDDPWRQRRLQVALAFLLSIVAVYLATWETLTIGDDDVVRIEYDGFTIFLSCAARSALRFEYRLDADTGNARRARRFRLDPRVPKRCQQWSTGSYARMHAGYDRGHLVPANHVRRVAVRGLGNVADHLTTDGRVR